ncbi:5-formyltetrahydrofolate cyclo-ligase [Hwanghaeella sp.]|uniref:5-formyltetrahydrofolate cyclo-ligase n=1 Tax=Hwanghaeella sp. TaxID=2605943 RepID=UPI003CCC2CB3
MSSSDEEPGSFASPPCFMHEIDPAYSGLAAETDPVQAEDVKRWRKAERDRLIAARMEVAPSSRQAYDARIIEELERLIGSVRGKTVGVYSPFRGEPNLHPLLKKITTDGGQCALPVVIARGKPLIYRAWSPGDPTVRGVWNIPVPEETAAQVQPDIVIAPVVGYDPSGYRLGYGGGFYDRTLAGMATRPRVFGVGYTLAALPTIFPQWHDIPMDLVVTENGPAV